MARARPPENNLRELAARLRNNGDRTSVFSFCDFRYPENNEDPETPVRLVTSQGEKLATWRLWV
jgi:hypothetical protein